MPGALLSSLLQHYDTKAQKEAVTCPVHRAKKKKLAKLGLQAWGSCCCLRAFVLIISLPGTPSLGRSCL